MNHSCLPAPKRLQPMAARQPRSLQRQSLSVSPEHRGRHSNNPWHLGPSGHVPVKSLCRCRRSTPPSKCSPSCSWWGRWRSPRRRTPSPAAKWNKNAITAMTPTASSGLPDPRSGPQFWQRSATRSHQDTISNLSACNPYSFCYKNETVKGWKAWKGWCSPEAWEQERGVSLVLKISRGIGNLEISDPTTTYPTLYFWSMFSINSNTNKTPPLAYKFFNSENVKATRQMFEGFLQP